MIKISKRKENKYCSVGDRIFINDKEYILAKFYNEGSVDYMVSLINIETGNQWSYPFKVSTVYSIPFDVIEREVQGKFGDRTITIPEHDDKLRFSELPNNCIFLESLDSSSEYGELLIKIGRTIYKADSNGLLSAVCYYEEPTNYTISKVKIDFSEDK